MKNDHVWQDQTTEVAQLRAALQRLLGCFTPFRYPSGRPDVCLYPPQFGGAGIPDYAEYLELCKLAGVEAHRD